MNMGLKGCTKSTPTLGTTCEDCGKTGDMHRGWIIEMKDEATLRICWQCCNKRIRQEEEE
tara:strand:- start:256 stop:435 length:180 start_codon:yes stop_codon:yes gene_type:complete